MSTYVFVALVFVSAALLIVALCDRGDETRRRSAIGGYDGYDTSGNSEGWSFGGPTDYDDHNFFSSDDRVVVGVACRRSGTPPDDGIADCRSIDRCAG